MLADPLVGKSSLQTRFTKNEFRVENLGLQTSGIILVYDITKGLTFQNIEEWLNKLRQDANPELVFLLVGNKMDL